MLERAKSSILPNGNFREFVSLAGGFCVLKTGIPGGPDRNMTEGRAGRQTDGQICRGITSVCIASNADALKKNHRTPQHQKIPAYHYWSAMRQPTQYALERDATNSKKVANANPEYSSFSSKYKTFVHR